MHEFYISLQSKNNTPHHFIISATKPLCNGFRLLLFKYQNFETSYQVEVFDLAAALKLEISCAIKTFIWQYFTVNSNNPAFIR